MMAAVLLALTLAFALSIWILRGIHRESVFELNRAQLLRQFTSVVHLLETTPREYHRLILKASRGPGVKMYINNENSVPDSSPGRQEARLLHWLNRSLGENYNRPIYLDVQYNQKELANWIARWKEEETNSSGEERDSRHMHRHHREGRSPKAPMDHLNISLQLRNGQWLNFLADMPDPPPLAPRQAMIFLLVSGASLLLMILFLVRRISRPLGKLATAANRVGVGETIEPVKEEGAEDVRETIKAFNGMNQRLQRFVSDRTRMLAALSHDLRTPLTTMRLRVEMMEDSPDKERLLNTLEEMLQMSEATLAFARQASENEPTRNVDLAALINSLCEDLEDLGQPVHFLEDTEVDKEKANEIIVACRIVSLKRALRNLLENAVRYGQEAKVSLQKADDGVKVIIQDSGSGIPKEKMEQVFEPFYRLESSRSRDTGGAGLGLSIARNIIRSHGGDITLQNTEKGLKVTVSLPCS